MNKANTLQAALWRALNHALNAITPNLERSEQRAYEKHLAQAGSLAEVETMQRQWQQQSPRHGIFSVGA